MPTEVTLERYAEMRAEIEAGALRDDVLRRFDISPVDWLNAQRTWLDRIGDELSRGRFELSNRYSQVFLDRQGALAKPGPAEVAPSQPASSQPAASPVMSPAPVVAPSFESASVVAPPSVASPAPPSELPSFLRTPAASVSAAPSAPAPPTYPAQPTFQEPASPSSFATETAEVDVAAILRAVKPFAPGSPGRPSQSVSSTPSAPPAPASPPAATPLSGQTLDAADLSAIVKKVVPFGGAGVPASAASPSEKPPAEKLSAEKPSAERSPGTVAFSVPAALSASAPVPFAQRSSDQAAIESAQRHAEAVQGPAKPKPSFSGETVDAFDVAALLKRPVPFSPGASAAQPGAPPASPSAPVAPGPPAASTAVAANTPAAPSAPVGTSTSVASGTPASPTAAGPPVRSFTLEQYASLCEDLAFSGGRSAEVLARYGITDAERRALDDHWTALFQKQPMTFLSWQSARATYRAWVRKQRGT